MTSKFESGIFVFPEYTFASTSTPWGSRIYHHQQTIKWLLNVFKFLPRQFSYSYYPLPVPEDRLRWLYTYDILFSLGSQRPAVLTTEIPVATYTPEEYSRL